MRASHTGSDFDETLPRAMKSLILASLTIAIVSLSTIGGASPPRQYTDEATAATITVVAEPWVFARSRRDLAANARDYVTLVAAAVDRAGRIEYVIVAYVWSTIDERLDPERRRDTSTLVIAADDRRIELTMPVAAPDEVGIADPVLPPPGPLRAPQVYRIDLGTLRFLAAARSVSLLLGADPLAPTYDIWNDGRPALGSFVEEVSGAR
jgi:hypothetical protein